jgi:phage tail-like protein
MNSSTKPDRILQYSFAVEIDQIAPGGFLDVEGLESVTEEQVTPLGGILRRDRASTNTKYSNLVLRRRFTENTDLWEWRRTVIEQGSSGARRNGSIIVSDEQGHELAKYDLSNIWPCRWKLSGLHQPDAVVIEEIELVVESFRYH